MKSRIISWIAAISLVTPLAMPFRIAAQHRPPHYTVIDLGTATGRLHLWQPANGPAQICVTSLLQCFG